MIARLLSFALVAALVAGAAARPLGTSRLIVAQTVEPASLDPLVLTGSPAEEVGTLVYSFLVRIDDRGRLVPDLAARVPTLANGDIARDGRTITYHLRRGVRWHDGEPFSAADVLATYRAVMDPRNPVPTRLGYDDVAALETPDPATVRVRLRKPFAPFLTYFFETESYPIVPAHVLARTPALAGSDLATAPIGTGPYRVVRWNRGDDLTLAANDAYFGGAPHIATLVIRFVPNPQTIAAELQTGEVDATFNADPALAGRLRANPRLRVRLLPIYGFTALTFQTRDPALRDPRVRAAVVQTFAIARDVARVSFGTLSTDDATRALFTWATIPVERPTVHAPLPAHLTLAYDAGSVLDRNVAEEFQADASRAGLALDLIPYATSFLLAPATQNGPIESGHFQLAMHAILTGADPETSWLLACDQIPPAAFNVSRYCNRDVDRALADALVASDEARRKAAYARVQRAVARDVPFVALWQTREIEALPVDLRGFRGSPETPYFGVEGWTR
jgi:peptide/nickel transport system substrate-binding protein